MHLIVVTQKHIKTVFLWYPGGSTTATTPFTKTAGGITGSLKHGGNGFLFGTKGCATTIDSH